MRYNNCMVPSSDLQNVVDRQLFPGVFIFHGISKPVIRKVNGIYYIAMFITPFNILGFTDGKFDRPYYWVTADLETGDLVQVFQCHADPDEEFCNSAYERRYDLRLVTDKVINKSYFEKVFPILDEVRSKLLLTGEFDQRLYNLYKKRLLTACPLPYRKFFRDLSI